MQRESHCAGYDDAVYIKFSLSTFLSFFSCIIVHTAAIENIAAIFSRFLYFFILLIFFTCFKLLLIFVVTTSSGFFFCFFCYSSKHLHTFNGILFYFIYGILIALKHISFVVLFGNEDGTALDNIFVCCCCIFSEVRNVFRKNNNNFLVCIYFPLNFIFFHAYGIALKFYEFLNTLIATMTEKTDNFRGDTH